MIGIIHGLEKEILRIYKTKPYSRQACLKRASKYAMEDRFNDYVELYKKVLG